MERMYTSGEVAKVCRVTNRQLQWWHERGYVRPLMIGHSRMYTAAQVITCGVFADATRKGITLATVRKRMHDLNSITKLRGAKRTNDDINFLVIESNPTHPAYAVYSDDVMGLLFRMRGPFVLVSVKEIREALANLKPRNRP